VALLGFAFYDLFFILYNLAVSYTTAAHASLALSTLPLQTMIVGALLGIEALSWRKTIGVSVAVLARLADPRRHHHDRQSDRRCAAGPATRRRATDHRPAARLARRSSPEIWIATTTSAQPAVR